MKPIYINFLTTEERSSKKVIVLLLAVLSCAVYLICDTTYLFYKQKKAIEQYRIKIEAHSLETKTETIKSRIGNSKEHDENLNSNIKKFSPSEIEEIKADIRFLDILLKSSLFPWIDILNRLEFSIDDGLIFTNIEIDKETKKIFLKGRADSAENLSLFIKAISSEKLFLLNSLSQESKQDTAINFDMGVSINLVDLDKRAR